MKLYGYFDNSSRYGIQKIICPTERYNSQFLIDNDLTTTWGLLEHPIKKENLDIQFRHPISISSLQLLLDMPLEKEIPYSKIKLFCSNDGLKWNEVIFSTDDMRYLTFPPLSCAHIRIQYCGDGTNYWGISEIRINEVDN